MIMIEVMTLISVIIVATIFIYIEITKMIEYKCITRRGLITITGLLVATLLLAIDVAYAITGRDNVSIEEIDRVVYAENVAEDIARCVEEEVVEVDIEIEEIEVHFDNEYDEMIYQATKDTVVDPYLAIAISRLETGHYTSDAFINGHNFGGMTGSKGVMSFPSIYNGLDRYVKMLEWYYEMDMDTPQKMQATYCPPNDEWDDIVSSIYNELR